MPVWPHSPFRQDKRLKNTPAHTCTQTDAPRPRRIIALRAVFSGLVLNGSRAVWDCCRSHAHEQTRTGQPQARTFHCYELLLLPLLLLLHVARTLKAPIDSRYSSVLLTVTLLHSYTTTLLHDPHRHTTTIPYYRTNTHVNRADRLEELLPERGALLYYYTTTLLLTQLH